MRRKEIFIAAGGPEDQARGSRTLISFLTFRQIRNNPIYCAAMACTIAHNRPRGAPMVATPQTYSSSCQTSTTARSLAMPSTRLSAHWHWTRLSRPILASPLPARHHRFGGLQPFATIHVNSLSVTANVTKRQTADFKLDYCLTRANP